MTGRTRLALVGRQSQLLEIVINGWPDAPQVGSLALQKLNFASSQSIKALTQEAEQYTKRLGYHADTFLVIGYARESLVALVPRHSCDQGAAEQALSQLWAW